ncbi:MAG: carboxypeptidase-like regulatory domain-containing protein, partial [Bacteroidales bacterium]|nr:carboxypeptidase-like regulatory domain-containing protein [Bacteroidales bacterium]
MRHLTLFFVLSLFVAFTGLAQTGSVQGIVIDGKTTKPLENIFVQVNGTAIDAYTNQNGEFLLNNVPIGIGTLIFTGDDYEPKELECKLSSGELLQIGSVTMKLASGSDDITVIVLDESELEDDESNMQG